MRGFWEGTDFDIHSMIMGRILTGLPYLDITPRILWGIRLAYLAIPKLLKLSPSLYDLISYRHESTKTQSALDNFTNDIDSKYRFHYKIWNINRYSYFSKDTPTTFSVLPFSLSFSDAFRCFHRYNSLFDCNWLFIRYNFIKTDVVQIYCSTTRCDRG